MVRKRTPVKFKPVEHRSYLIRYLHMSELFKLLLGKFFARYDKPYYTIIDNYVILQATIPVPLESMIDDYLDHNTLRRQDDFMTFRNRFDSENAVFFYANTPILFNALNLADQKTRASMVTNKEYIVCFEKIGFQVDTEDGHFAQNLREALLIPADVPLAKPAETVTRDSVMDELRLDSAEFQAAITQKSINGVATHLYKDVNAKILYRLF